jgi:two-component system sensor histidine kinase SenX3
MTPVLWVAIAVAVVTAVVTFVIARVLWGRELRNRAYDSAMRIGVDLPSAGGEYDIDELMVGIERLVRELRSDGIEGVSANGRLQAALDGIAEAVMVFEPDGALIEHNEAAEPFLAARHGDALVGAAVDDLVRIAISGERASTSVELFGPPRRSVIISTIPMIDSSGPGAIAFVDDVTERRHLEAIRTDFVANISHELKTPVGAIGLLAETLLAEDDPAIVDRLATRIHNESMRIARIIEDLLELTRIETRALPEYSPVSLDVVINDVRDRLREASAQAKVDVVVVPSDGESVVLGDRRQLVSAVANLLDNALKYSDPGSSVEVGAAHDGEDVVITVSDHGIGIPTRDIERVFERFYRVDHARSRQTGGTGLGLAIVRHVAVNHGATVEVESRLGEGSSFHLRFPAVGSTAFDAEESEAKSPHDMVPEGA